jgi:hypothetical protein
MRWAKALKDAMIHVHVLSRPLIGVVENETMSTGD